MLSIIVNFVACNYVLLKYVNYLMPLINRSAVYLKLALGCANNIQNNLFMEYAGEYKHHKCQ